MKKTPTFQSFLSYSCAIFAFAAPTFAVAQTVPNAVPSPSISTRLPVQLPAETTETSVGADGVETITRTRRIPARVTNTIQPAPSGPAPAYPGAPYPQPVYPAAPYPTATYPSQPVAAPVVYGREQWIEECRRRTEGRSDKDRSKLIGGLLGAAAGGLAGNRIASGERLGGTLIGAGAGGLAGAAIGDALKGEDRSALSDCTAALDNHLSQYSAGGERVASRTIPATTAYPANAPQGYYPRQTPYYQPYQQPNQVWIPVQVEQPQRVIVRETVREIGAPAVRRVPVPKGSKLVRE